MRRAILGKLHDSTAALIQASKGRRVILHDADEEPVALAALGRNSDDDIN